MCVIMCLQLLASAGPKKSRQDRRQARKTAREEARQTRDGGSGGPQGASRDDAIRRATGSQFADMHSAAAAGAEGGDGSSSAGSGSDTGGEAAAAVLQQPGDAAEQQQQQQQAQGNGSAQGALSAGGAAAAAAGDADSDEEEGDAAARELAAAKDEAERAEISALLAEENVAELPYEEGDAAAALMKELDSLTGLPRGDDVLMYAVPVCGPYQALAAYKLKVSEPRAEAQAPCDTMSGRHSKYHIAGSLQEGSPMESKAPFGGRVLPWCPRKQDPSRL